MRKFVQLIGILLLGLVIFMTNTISFPHLLQVSEEPTTDPLEGYEEIEILDEPDHAIIEYGRSEFIVDNYGPLYTFIRFPQGGHSTTDAVILEWAQTINNQLSAEFQRMQDATPDSSLIGEINIQFDSFLVDNRYVGIFQYGEYSYYLEMVPEEIIQTFNIDLESLTFLESEDILDFSQSDMILELLYERTLEEHPDTRGHLSFIDSNWLNQLVIANEGIIVILEKQHMFLPETFPTLTVTLPYDELGSALRIRNLSPLDAPPAPDVQPAPILDTTEHTDYDGPSVIPQFGDIDPSQPMIAITFNGGPGVYTEQLLDLFELYGVRVTFFTVGNLVNSNAAYLSRAANFGHEVAGNSWDHSNMAKLSAEDVEAQIIETSETIEAVTGVAVPFFRPPFGAISNTMRDVAAELGFAMIHWTFDSRDWETQDPDAIFDAVLINSTNGAIVLNHETHRSTLEAYMRLIPELLERGFQFVTISELFEYRLGELEPGQVYYGR